MHFDMKIFFQEFYHEREWKFPLMFEFDDFNEFDSGKSITNTNLHCYNSQKDLHLLKNFKAGKP